ncbi:polyribonucleotide nucleotidyltransferase [Haliangium ochraceum]|uniref:Polyribonucleotide nucleotidyltransferase n=1 Tax=Haliangium ochraceum (strain DSM 14365 / JCM 11303 / SMP-2) TaxID=502025 RepID=D0LZ84_HALO1|nr:polyribonucleotide nucleotidyltransferase [Haliangium ochraceum]ACY16346.1 polyribonucleotide nucleotidyltransferase [Haliangium ochraceum DSM 14365]
MRFVRESVTVGDKEIIIETGKWAKQASGSVVVRCGDTMVLVTATASKSPRVGMDFLPLTCEYQEKTYSAGKIPGNFFRREARPSTDEVLVARLMDRPSRPLFPKLWRCETQLIANVVSFDQSNAADVLAMTGSSCALHISDIPWDGPVAAVRVGRVAGEFVAFPTFEEREQSDIDMIVSASRDAIVMVEGGMREVPEQVLIDALLFAHEAVQPLIDLQEKLRAAVGKEKRPFEAPSFDQDLLAKVQESAWERVREAFEVREKHSRSAALSDVRRALVGELCGAQENATEAVYAGREDEVSEAYEKVKKRFARLNTLDSKHRIDGRAYDEIRAISCEVGILPSAHGSALFTRGETQALVSATMGTRYDEQKLDTLLGGMQKPFFLHYNFPPFCTGEAKPIRSTSRRELGHGNLAERSIAQVMPEREDFPYTVRVVSEILESNGSSSMASVCGASLSLMDAGVPVLSPVAGIAMGLMMEGERYAILSDILGDEDHMGDMDFKVTGTARGVCALQMDIKLKGLTRDILVEALEQARRGRMHILDKMAEALQTPREDLSPNAPRIVTETVKPDKIRDIIGPGGKTIRAIAEQTGAKIDVSDAGVVSIASSDSRSLQQAIDIIRGLTMEPEVGQFYGGVVKRIVEFGAFVEILPGTDGLVHISELSSERVRRVEDVIQEGEEIVVKCISVDRDGKIRLSLKEAADANPDDILHFVA